MNRLSVFHCFICLRISPFEQSRLTQTSHTLAFWAKAWQPIGEAIAVSERHQEAHTCQTLSEVLIETASRTCALVEVQHRMRAGAKAVEQE